MGYSIDQLKKASAIEGQDAIPIMQSGLTKQIEEGMLYNAKIITASGSQSSGIIRKEMTYVLKNNSAAINFTLNNAVGRKLSNNAYTDDAATAAGWIIKVLNVSTRSHVIIIGSNSWDIAKNETMFFYWTGSAWTLHNARMNNIIVDGSLKFTTPAAISSVTGTTKITGLDTSGNVKYTTPDAIKTALSLVDKSDIASDHKKIGEFAHSSSTDADKSYYYKITGFTNVVGGNQSDEARITMNTRYTSRLVINAIAYATVPGQCVTATIEDTNGTANTEYGVKYDISNGIFNIYVKLKVGTNANRQIFFLENRTSGANNVIVTEETDETNYNAAQYTCTIGKAIKETDLNNAIVNDNVKTNFFLTANTLVDTGIYLNKSVNAGKTYKYRKSFILILTCLNGLGLATGNRIYNLYIGRNGNTFNKVLISEVTYSSTTTYLNNVELLPSSEETESNDDNTLCLRLNTSVTNMIVSAVII